MFKSVTIDPERRAEITKLIGRAALIVLPMLALITFAALLVWNFRRQAVLPENPVVEPEEEPAYEVPSEPVTS
jgi:hypothetical protein